MTHVVESQDQVFAWLAEPATHGGAAVKRVDTHAAVVFLTPERVLKVKRAVRFPFLDFSTLDKRKAACEAELAINRSLRKQLRRAPYQLRADTAFAEVVRGCAETPRPDQPITVGRTGHPANEWIRPINIAPTAS